MSAITDLFATKIGMTQAWTQEGKRVPVTRLQAEETVVLGVQKLKNNRDFSIVELGHGKKKLKNVDKPLRSRIEKIGLSQGFKQVTGTRVENDTEVPALGTSFSLEQVLEIGDVVQVQGVTRGKGFTGGMKRHGFHGGPATHGQSDRARAVGSIGQQDTGRVFKGKKMPGHSGDTVKTVKGLVVLHIDPAAKEIWLSGPIPGSAFSSVKVSKTGQKKSILLNKQASGLPKEEVAAPAEEVPEVIVEEVVTEVVETPAEEQSAS